MKSLSQKQYEVLVRIEIDKAKGYNPTMSSLARDFNLSFPRMRNIVLELEHKGYVKLVIPLKKGNRRTCSKNIIVLEPVLSKKEEYVVIGNNLTMDEIRGATLK